MKISELKEFLNNLPEEIQSHQIIYRRFEDDGETLMLLDYPLTTFYIDEESEECVFLDEDNWDYFSKNLLITDDENNENSDETE